MVVEDPFVSGLLRSLLTGQGYRVALASVSHGLELLRSAQAIPDLLITNQPAPFATMGDSLPLLYLAASPDPQQAAAFPNCSTLRKPFEPRQLLEAVRHLVESGVAVG